MKSIKNKRNEWIGRVLKRSGLLGLIYKVKTRPRMEFTRQIMKGPGYNSKKKKKTARKASRGGEWRIAPISELNTKERDLCE